MSVVLTVSVLVVVPEKMEPSLMVIPSICHWYLSAVVPSVNVAESPSLI